MSRRSVAQRLFAQGQTCMRSLSTTPQLQAQITGRPGEDCPSISNTHQSALNGKMVVRCACNVRRSSVSDHMAHFMHALAMCVCRVCFAITVSMPLAQVPERLLMGPGPSNAHPAVLAAQSLPLLGALLPPCIMLLACQKPSSNPRAPWMSRLCRTSWRALSVTISEWQKCCYRAPAPAIPEDHGRHSGGTALHLPDRQQVHPAGHGHW